MSYLNSVTIVGFVGADPEQRQARNNGSKFTVLSVATQRSWKNAEDEWVSKVEWHRVAIFGPRLAEAVLTNVKKGAHVLVEGTHVGRLGTADRRRMSHSATKRFRIQLQNVQVMATTG
jgi:single stranded DNA-binding protein